MFQVGSEDGSLLLLGRVFHIIINNQIGCFWVFNKLFALFSIINNRQYHTKCRRICNLSKPCFLLTSSRFFTLFYFFTFFFFCYIYVHVSHPAILNVPLFIPLKLFPLKYWHSWLQDLVVEPNGYVIEFPFNEV